MSKFTSKCIQDRNALKEFACKVETKHHFYKCKLMTTLILDLQVKWKQNTTIIKAWPMTTLI